MTLKPDSVILNTTVRHLGKMEGQAIVPMGRKVVLEVIRQYKLTVYEPLMLYLVMFCKLLIYTVCQTFSLGNCLIRFYTSHKPIFLYNK